MMLSTLKKMREGFLKELEDARRDRMAISEKAEYLDKRVEQLTGAVYGLEKAIETLSLSKGEHDGTQPEIKEVTGR